MPNTECTYCQAAPERLKLADALESGEYNQVLPSDRLNGVLRNPDDHYNITGVATAALTNSVWVRTGRMWAAFSLDTFTAAFPEAKHIPVEFPSPSRHSIGQLEKFAGPGQITGCPEETACTLGLHEDTEQSTHPEVIWFHTDDLTDDQKKESGIPRDWAGAYVLDTLDFTTAAALLRQYPNLLEGHHTCPLS